MYIHIHKSPAYVHKRNKAIVAEYGFIGATLYSNGCGTFTILRKVTKEKNHYLFEIRFSQTGSHRIVRGDRLLKGEVKDYTAPTIRGIACLGSDYLEIRDSDPKLCKSMMTRYTAMIERCYCKDNHNYKFYGKLGVTVCDEWLNFCNYYRDIISLDNFDRELFINAELVVDKDIKQIDLPHNKRVYAKNTVTLIPEDENLRNRELINCGKLTGEKTSKYFACILPNGDISYHKNICKFAKQLGISDSSIRDVLRNRISNTHGYKFRWLTPDEEIQLNNGSLIIN